MKTPTGYVALRNGRNNIRNCIFLNWFDAELFITDFDNAEYSILDSLQDAEKYIMNDNSSFDTDQNLLSNITKTLATRTTAAASPPPLDLATIDDMFFDDVTNTATPCTANELPMDESKNYSSTTNISPNQEDSMTNATTPGRLPAIQPAINQNENSEHNKNITDDSDNTTTHVNQALLLTQTPVQVPFISTADTAFYKSQTTNNNNGTCNPRPAWLGWRCEVDEKWKQSFETYLSYRNPNNGTFPQPIPDRNVQDWLHEQGIEYGKKLLNLPNTLSKEKEEMLHSGGIVFFIHESIAQALQLLVKKQQQEQQQKTSSPVAARKEHNQQQRQIQQQNQKPFSSPIFAGKEQHNDSSLSVQSIRKQPCLLYAVEQGQQKQQQYDDGISSTTPENSRPQKRSKILYQQPIQQAWKDNFAKLKQYINTHDGDWNVTDKDDDPLRSWLMCQKDEYRLMKEGKVSTFSEQKLALLRQIGVDFDKKVHSWSDRVEQLIQYKKENGHLDVPCTHPVLGRWVHNMIQEYEYMCTGKPVKFLNLEKIKELRNAGVADFFNKIDEEKQLIWNGKFELMFYKLKEYKEKHGSSCVSGFKNEYNDLYKWYCRVLAEYRKSLGMENAVTCLLSTRQIDRLKEIGFDFTPPTKLKRGNTIPFDERIKQLKEFQRNGGDISKIAVSDTKFGSFIHRQKREYLLWRQGQPSTLNEKKVKVLESIGVQLDDVEKCVDPNDLGLFSRWSWDQRFQQLLEYKEKHGHVMVPQRTKDCLGIWVKDQRRCYRLMQQGVRGRKIRGMTEERVKKLTDIGFIFDATTGFKQRNRKKKNKNKGTTSTMETPETNHTHVEDNGNNEI